MSDASDLVGFVGGGAGALAGATWLVQRLVGRVIQREDEDKKLLQLKVEEAQKSERLISESLIGLRHDLSALRAALEMVSKQMEVRADTQDKEIAGLRVEVKDQIQQLEHRLRSDMQRVVMSDRPRRTRP